MNKHLVIGLGEVGKAILQIFNADGIDLEESKVSQKHYKFIHICFPYEDELYFINNVKLYQHKFCPEYTIIHSTVPVVTSYKLRAIHSPIRGLHPNLYEGIKTFAKFIGGPDSSIVAEEFRRNGLKVIICDKAETTELGKLLDTEYYRACIEFTHRAKNLSDKYNVPFHEVYTLFNQTYNDGYTALGFKEYVRPVLQPIMKEIGGHCVMQNKDLLNGKDSNIPQ